MADQISVGTTGTIYDLLVHGGSCWLALCTDSGFTESTDYDGRVELNSLMAADPTGTDGANDSPIAFGFTLGDTLTHWAICNDETDPISTSYIFRGALSTPVVVAALGSGTFEVGTFVITIAGA